MVVLLLNVVVKRGEGGKWTTELQSPLPPLRETSLPKHTLDFYKSSNNSFTRSDRPFMKPSDMQPLTMARFITHQSQEFLGLNQVHMNERIFEKKVFSRHDSMKRR